jgi:serine/threonine protein kinase/cytochrome c-type biogenesis protein CcmH/NrfG
MSDASDPAVGMVIADRYILLEKIAEGATGTLYRAEHALLRNQLAVKLLHEPLAKQEGSLEAFQQHVTMAARIESEHLARISDFGRTEDNRVFIVMEYLDGETLGHLIAREHKLSEPRTLELLHQLGDVLAEAHALGLVHGDVRPRNIYLVQRKGTERVKLLGLGMNELAQAHAEKKTESEKRQHASDPHFMAPEQARGGSPSARSDLYAMAAVGYAMLSGAPPFAGTSRFDLLNKQMLAEPTPVKQRVPAVSERVSAAIDRALGKDPEQRFATVTQFMRELGIESTDAPPAQHAAPAAQTSGSAALAREDDGRAHATTQTDAEPSEAEANAEPNRSEPLETDGAPAQTNADPSESAAAPPDAESKPDQTDAEAAEAAGETPEAAEPAGETPEAAEPAGETPEAAKAPPEAESQASAAKPASVEPDNSKTLMGYDLSPEQLRQAIAQQEEPAETPPSSSAKTIIQGADVPQIEPDTFTRDTIVPGSSQHQDRTIQATHVSAALASADAQAATDAASEATDAPRDLVPDTHDPGESGEWFAQGMAAEEALQRSRSHSSLPAMYDALDEADGVRNRFTPSMILAGVIAVAAIALGIVFLLARSDAPEGQQKEAQQRVIPVHTSVADERESATRDAAAVAPDAKAAKSAAAAESQPDAGERRAADAAQAPPAKAAASANDAAASQDDKTAQTTPANEKPAATQAKEKTGATTSARQPDESTTRKQATPRPSKRPAERETRGERRETNRTRESARDSQERANRDAAQSRAKAEERIRLARAHLRRGNHTKAKQLFSEALDRAPKSAAAHGGLGEVSFELGDYASAARHLRTAVKLNPGSARYHVMLGNVYFKQGRTSAAVTQYRRALKISPNNQAARGGLEVAIRRMAEES